MNRCHHPCLVPLSPFQARLSYWRWLGSGTLEVSRKPESGEDAWNISCRFWRTKFWVLVTGLTIICTSRWPQGCSSPTQGSGLTAFVIPRIGCVCHQFIAVVYAAELLVERGMTLMTITNLDLTDLNQISFLLTSQTRTKNP